MAAAAPAKKAATWAEPEKKVETARERLERLENEYKVKRAKAKKRERESGPHLRWKPPQIEKLDPTQSALWKAVVDSDPSNDGDDQDLMHVLNKNEPEINFTYCGQTPFFYACNHGKYGVVQLLLRWPHPETIDVMKRSDGGETPFLAACRGNYLRLAQLLMDRDYEAPGIGKVLEDLDPNARANDGRSAVWCAAIKGHARILQWLLDSQETGVIDWETAADGLEGFDPPRKVTAIMAAKAHAHATCVPIIKEGIKRQRAKRARDRLRRAQKATRGAVRMRDADGVFFGTDAFDNSALGDLKRETHKLGNEKGIDYGGRMKQQEAFVKQRSSGKFDMAALKAAAGDGERPAS